jgi:hypothetical protein
VEGDMCEEGVMCEDSEMCEEGVTVCVRKV